MTVGSYHRNVIHAVRNIQLFSNRLWCATVYKCGVDNERPVIVTFLSAELRMAIYRSHQCQRGQEIILKWPKIILFGRGHVV